MLASLETQSEHPISKAVVNFAKEKNMLCNKLFDEIKIIAGQGIVAPYENKKCVLGHWDFYKTMM